MISWGLVILAFLALSTQLIEAGSSPRSLDNIEPQERSNKTVVANSTSAPIEKFNISLSLNQMRFINLPAGFVRSEYLTHLNLEDNEIEYISPAAFEFVPRVLHLSLANNSLRNIGLQQFSRISNLQTLDLSSSCKSTTSTVEDLFNLWHTPTPTTEIYPDYNEYNNTYSRRPPQRSSVEEVIRSIPCKVSFCDAELPHLTTLYLKNNNLTSLIICFGTIFPRLSRLDLSENFIHVDEYTMTSLGHMLPSISELHFKKSNISDFDVSHLPSLKSLFLDNNQLRSICNEYCEDSSLTLKGAENLEVLSVSGNKLSTIEPDSFNSTLNLSTLDLSRNEISEIRQGTFDKLKLLRSLNLEFNNLVRLNALDTFKGLIELETLFLGHNKLNNITDGAFNDLIKLKTLELNNNEIRNIDSGIFSSMTNLQELSLAYNQVSSIPEGSLPNSDSLITLNLDNNRFTDTKQIFIPNTPNVITLSLIRNPLSMVRVPWHSNSSKNLTIILNNNPSFPFPYARW